MQAEASTKAPRLVKTKTPGIYKRGRRYVVVYRDSQGRQRKRFAQTLAEARDLKSTLDGGRPSRRVPRAIAGHLRRVRGRDRRQGGDALIFPGRGGGPLDASTAFRAVRSAAVKAGVPWAGLHTLRHICASLLFEAGLNPVQIQRWLGHHRASFTIDTYVHLLSDELPEPPSLDVRPGEDATTGSAVAMRA